MNNTKKVVIKIGPGFCTSLFLIFLVLKLCHVIDWSWWWVTLPLWWGLGLLAALAVLALGIFILFGGFWVVAKLIEAVIDSYRDWKRRRLHNRINNAKSNFKP